MNSFDLNTVLLQKVSELESRVAELESQLKTLTEEPKQQAKAEIKPGVAIDWVALEHFINKYQLEPLSVDEVGIPSAIMYDGEVYKRYFSDKYSMPVVLYSGVGEDKRLHTLFKVRLNPLDSKCQEIIKALRLIKQQQQQRQQVAF